MGRCVLLLLLIPIFTQATSPPADEFYTQSVSGALQKLTYTIETECTYQKEIKTMVERVVENNRNRDDSKILDRLEELAKKVDQLKSQVGRITSESTKDATATRTPNTKTTTTPTPTTTVSAICKEFETFSTTLAPESLVKLASGGYYIDSARNITYLQARRICEKKNMEMVTLKSFDELDALRYKLPEGTLAWMAATDAGHAPGDFHWKDGTPVKASLWHKSETRTEPNNAKAGQQTCAYLWTAHNSLGDWKCDDNSGIAVCELPKKFTPCLP